MHCAEEFPEITSWAASIIATIPHDNSMRNIRNFLFICIRPQFLQAFLLFSQTAPIHKKPSTHHTIITRVFFHQYLIERLTDLILFLIVQLAHRLHQQSTRQKLFIHNHSSNLFCQQNCPYMKWISVDFRLFFSRHSSHCSRREVK